MKTIRQSAVCSLLLAAATGLLVVSPLGALSARADDEIVNNQSSKVDGYPEFFDISPRELKIPAGGSYSFTSSSFYARYDYTYYITGATSKSTYCECDWKGAGQPPVLHIGADETATSVRFFFYVDDAKHFASVNDTEKYAYVTVTVTPNAYSTAAAAPAAQTVSTGNALSLADGTTGSFSVIRDNTVGMLYNASGIALASFSVSDGSGTMPKFTYGGVVQQNGANYFSVTAANRNAVRVMISDSDKAVMTAKGFAGVRLNGTFVNW